jgi:hypothetical protein
MSNPPNDPEQKIFIFYSYKDKDQNNFNVASLPLFPTDKKEGEGFDNYDLVDFGFSLKEIVKKIIHPTAELYGIYRTQEEALADQKRFMKGLKKAELKSNLIVIKNPLIIH